MTPEWIQQGFSQEVGKKCGSLSGPTLWFAPLGYLPEEPMVWWKGFSRLEAFRHWYSDKHYQKFPCNKCRPEYEMYGFKEIFQKVLTETPTDFSTEVRGLWSLEAIQKLKNLLLNVPKTLEEPKLLVQLRYSSQLILNKSGHYFRH